MVADKVQISLQSQTIGLDYPMDNVGKWLSYNVCKQNLCVIVHKCMSLFEGILLIMHVCKSCLESCDQEALGSLV